VGALCAAAAAGSLNAGLIRIGIAPLVVTLATMAGYAGLAMAVAGGERVAGLPEGFTALGQGAVAGAPVQLWLLLVGWLATCAAVHFTRYGRYLYAIGDNRTAAALAGVPVGKVEWWLYTLNGLLAGVVGLLHCARGGAAVPNAGAGLELQVIACVVLGGTRVTGGAGGPGRTLIGWAILTNLEIGLRLMRRLAIPIPGTRLTWELSANVRLIAIGVLLIALAVFNERAMRQVRER
jgi:ribose/xylose/arabinose/galactoside ABC-type transport system permease subunit